MPEAPAEPRLGSPAVWTIPSHRSFADSLASGVIARFGKDPLAFARGRILLPNNRAVGTLIEAFVRHSGGGLLMPRLIPIGDPEISERIGAALDPADADDPPIPPAVDPLQRLLTLADLVRTHSGTAMLPGEALRLAADLERTIDALTIEEVDISRLAGAVDDAPDLAAHWQMSLDKLRVLLDDWPRELARMGRIDLADRRNRLLRSLGGRWLNSPPDGFTIAAGITTAAPAVAALLATIARMPQGAVVLPGLALDRVMGEQEWDALGPVDGRRPEETHPQFHLKLLLDRIGVARAEVGVWRGGGAPAAQAVRGRAVANAMTAADFSDKWNELPSAERRLTGVRCAEFPDPASEAQAIALAMREVLETPGRTAALVTPDRALAGRVSALLRRWNVAADDSAGSPLSSEPAGTLLLAIAAAAADRLGPVALLALIKHPLVRDGEARQQWLDAARALDLKLRGPRPPAGLAGLDQLLGSTPAWTQVRPAIAPLEQRFSTVLIFAAWAGAIRECATALAGEGAWRGPAGRMMGELLVEIENSPAATSLSVTAAEAVPMLRQLLDQRVVRPAYGSHPRLAIRGLLEARLHQADLMILGSLNEGVWPALPPPDPWLAPKIRAHLGLPGLEFRSGLSAHDFSSALGAPSVLLTRARRDSRSPTVASRFWLRLQAMTGGLTRDTRLERMVAALDQPVSASPVDRPAPDPPVEDRPDRIRVTAVDRLKADPFAFYANAMLKLSKLDPVDAEHSAAWKGTAVHKVLEEWLKQDDSDPDRLLDRAKALVEGEAIHPMLRALWQPRLLEAIDWIARTERSHRDQGRRAVAAEVSGEALIGGVTVYGKADRIDRLLDGKLVIVDYKTGKPPTSKAVTEGFALQLGLLGLIGRSGGFPSITGDAGRHEYWSLAKANGSFGKLVAADKEIGPIEFLDQAERQFVAIAAAYLRGGEPFTAKLHPAYAPYGDYDQLMRLEEWYGRA